MLDDGATEKIRKHIRKIDERITTAKVDMRKLPLQQKVIKNAEIKSIQQEVQTLREQEKSREPRLRNSSSKHKSLHNIFS